MHHVYFLFSCDAHFACAAGAGAGGSGATVVVGGESTDTEAPPRDAETDPAMPPEPEPSVPAIRDARADAWEVGALMVTVTFAPVDGALTARPTAVPAAR